MTPGELAQLGEENDRRSAAWRAGWLDGFATAAAQFEAIESRGYAKAIGDVKAAEHGLVSIFRDVADTEARRWTLRGESRTRATFAQPHKDDYPGKAGAA